MEVGFQAERVWRDEVGEAGRARWITEGRGATRGSGRGLRFQICTLQRTNLLQVETGLGKVAGSGLVGSEPIACL